MTANGYRQVIVDGVRWYEHRWVWTQANGPIPEGWEVHHLDRDPTNNALSNLIALTPEAHRRLHGTEFLETRKVCVICGAEYEPPMKNRGARKTCSPPCRARAIGDAVRARRAGGRP